MALHDCANSFVAAHHAAFYHRWPCPLLCRTSRSDATFAVAKNTYARRMVIFRGGHPSLEPFRRHLQCRRLGVCGRPRSTVYASDMVSCSLVIETRPTQGLTLLPASQRVDVLHALRQRHFKPAFAAILSAEHLAIARGDVDLLGVAVMQADRHQRPVRRHLVEALPGLADVLAAVERAVFR